MGQGQSVAKQLTFHPSHGKDTVLDNNDLVATRLENTTKCWSKGLVFSDQPIKTNQKIYIEVIVVSGASHDVISFGFTSQDPAESLSDEEENEKCSWTGSLSKHFCAEGSVIYFYVNNAGYIHYGKLNGCEKEILSKKVEVNRRIWAVVYIWNEPTTIKLLNQTEARQVMFSKKDEKRRCRNNSPARKVTKEVGIVADLTDDSGICIICCGCSQDAVFVPCGHICTCYQCGHMVQNGDNTCPICRKRVERIIKVYKS